MKAGARIGGCLLFGAAMGFFEAACVIYLRRLWELGDHDLWGFSLANRTVLTEFLREWASLAMIASVAWLAGRRGTERLACAAIIFGTWDVLYYVYLWLLIGWPSGPLDWDILFLIPVPWSGPVIAPVTVAIGLVVGGSVALLREDSGRPMRPGALSWGLGLLGGGLVVASFIAARVPFGSVWPGGSPDPDPPAGSVPPGDVGTYPWSLLLLGLAVALGGYLLAAMPRKGAPPRAPEPSGSRRGLESSPPRRTIEP